MGAPKGNKYALGNTNQKWETSPQITNVSNYCINDFSTEKEMCDYIDKYAHFPATIQHLEFYILTKNSMLKLVN